VIRPDTEIGNVRAVSRQSLLLLLIMSLFLLVAGCGLCLMPYGGCMGQADYARYKEFWTLPTAGRIVAIRKYSLDQQLDIYRLSMGEEPPGDSELAGPIAENGAKIVPLVRQQLRDTTSEHYKVDLVYLLSQPGTCRAVAQDKTLVLELKESVRNISDSAWDKPRAVEALGTITAGCVNIGHAS
jgi:hypothetical protein